MAAVRHLEFYTFAFLSRSPCPGRPRINWLQQVEEDRSLSVGENAGQLFVAMVILLFTLCFIVDETSSKSQDVHAPAANLTELKKTAALREKMAAIREKRRVNAMLG